MDWSVKVVRWAALRGWAFALPAGAIPPAARAPPPSPRRRRSGSRWFSVRVCSRDRSKTSGDRVDRVSKEDPARSVLSGNCGPMPEIRRMSTVPRFIQLKRTRSATLEKNFHLPLQEACQSAIPHTCRSAHAFLSMRAEPGQSVLPGRKPIGDAEDPAELRGVHDPPPGRDRADTEVA